MYLSVDWLLFILEDCNKQWSQFLFDDLFFISSQKYRSQCLENLALIIERGVI